ncbi:MAG: hypothetical protein B6D35_14355 [Candidatus Brocadia sp. UTAMX2]|jgi:CRISPR-associated protein Csx10|nr:MAG: hypothetical protein B6D35_14355 [Candidatus Brocadia sp. UTAMX2]
MAYIRIEAEVIGNIVIGSTPIIANHIESADSVSGSMLRGALAGIWSPDDAGNEDFLSFFCRDDIRFRGLFPIPSGTDGTDFLTNSHFPFQMPLSAFGCKYDAGMGRGGHGFIDGALNSLAAGMTCPHCHAPLKQCRDTSYYYMLSGKPKPITTKKEIYIYHGTERSTKRAKNAALYSYTSVRNGERFLGWLTGTQERIDCFWKRLRESARVSVKNDSEIEANLRIGRAKKRRGYLRCTMKKIAPDADREETLHPLFSREANPKLRSDNRLIIMLQTPAIVYDRLFRPLTTLRPDEFFSESKLKDKVTEVNGRTFSATTVIDGWSGVHKLPRVPEIAVAAGSTFVFTLNTAAVDHEGEALEELKKIQADGIGERKNEGYGQILINPPFHRGEGKWLP